MNFLISQVTGYPGQVMGQLVFTSGKKNRVQVKFYGSGRVGSSQKILTRIAMSNGNLAPHCCLAPHRCLAPLKIILLYWVFFQDCLCGLLWALYAAIYHFRSNCERDPSLLH